MNGSDDVRPGSARRASDPSLEDMLRRARDAPLGDPIDHAAPGWSAYVPPLQERRGGRLWGWMLFAAGVLAGVLLSICVVTVTATVSSWTAQISSATPMAIATTLPAAPTSVPTPLPTDTPSPTVKTVAPPPTDDELISLVQDFYDTQGPYAGDYVLLDVTDLQIQSQDETQLTACVSYKAASVNAPDTVAFSNTRLFTLAANSDGSWQVAQMGGSGSCTLD